MQPNLINKEKAQKIRIMRNYNDQYHKKEMKEGVIFRSFSFKCEWVELYYITEKEKNIFAKHIRMHFICSKNEILNISICAL